ncbi:helix-turn-helix transcriptional regulator [Vibrio owensii]|uniref:helix-turn-helix transcriptional regulator n=1 Tax=Vibrio owensii TaxID=696485 RepID=UPI0005EE46A1|nr:WYL domain-containing protein [Vibrio owensii]
MSLHIQRYQKVLESIPCYPESISSLEIKERLQSSELLNSTTDEKSQLRTVQRYINNVASDHASIEVNDASKPYLYQIAKGHRHPVKPDGMSSVVSLQVIEKEIKSMLPPTLRSDVDSIFYSLSHSHTKQTKLWNERFCYLQSEYPLTAPTVDNELFKLIEEALLKKKDIAFSYKKPGAKNPSDYISTPLGLFLYANTFYLLGLVPGTLNTFRNFALHRIYNLKLSYSSTNAPSYFNVREYIQDEGRYFSGGPLLRVELKIKNATRLNLIEETLLSEKQKIISRDNAFTLIEAEVRDSRNFEEWLMKHANIIEVIAPIKLREKIIDNLKVGLSMYGVEF